MGNLKWFYALAWALLLCIGAPVADAQGPPKPGHESPAERWQGMTKEQHRELQKRFEKLQKMTTEERAALKARAKELLREREGMEKALDPKLREQLRGMTHAERNHVLRGHQLGERRRLGQEVRESLSPGRSGWLDSLFGPGQPRPFHELRAEVRGKTEKHVLDKLSGPGGLAPEERVRIEGLPPKQRTLELLNLHRQRIEIAIEKSGLPEGIPPGKWKQLRAEQDPQRFIKGARNLGLDMLGPPPLKRHPNPLFRELDELLRPTLEDRLAVGQVPRREQRKLMDERVGGRLRALLGDPSWLPSLDRVGLFELSNAALVRKLRKLLPGPPHLRPR